MTRPRHYFVSDLHLFSRRSLARRHEADIHAAARRARTFVLGGDIFDFRWSTVGSPQQTVAAALRWLDELVAPHPDCRFHFVVGNHDCNRRFLTELADYQQTRPNLACHRYFVRLGRSVFLHGDAADRPQMCHHRLERSRWQYVHDEAPRGRMRNLLYDLVARARLHTVASGVAHPAARVAQRLLAYLQRHGHGPESGTRHVYFGHTHRSLSHYPFGGLSFHNGGAPIAGLQFRIVEAEIDEPAGH